MFDVGTLLEDAETKTAALERVEELEESMATVRPIGVKADGCLFSDDGASARRGE